MCFASCNLSLQAFGQFGSSGPIAAEAVHPLGGFAPLGRENGDFL